MLTGLIGLPSMSKALLWPQRLVSCTLDGQCLWAFPCCWWRCLRPSTTMAVADGGLISVFIGCHGIVTCCTVAMVWSSILRMAWCTVTYSIVWIIRAIRSHIVSCGCYGIRSDIVLPYRYYGIQSHIVFCGCHGIQSHAVLCGRLSKRPHIVSRVDAIVYGFILHRVDAIVYGHIFPVWMPCLVIIM